MNSIHEKYEILVIKASKQMQKKQKVNEWMK